jgi:hypothetical protein
MNVISLETTSLNPLHNRNDGCYFLKEQTDDLRHFTEDGEMDREKFVKGKLRAWEKRIRHSSSRAACIRRSTQPLPRCSRDSAMFAFTIFLVPTFTPLTMIPPGVYTLSQSIYPWGYPETGDFERECRKSSAARLSGRLPTPAEKRKGATRWQLRHDQ